LQQCVMFYVFIVWVALLHGNNRKGSSNNKYRISDIRKKKVPIPTVPSAHPLKINAPLLKAVWSRLWCDLEWKRKKNAESYSTHCSGFGPSEWQ